MRLPPYKTFTARFPVGFHFTVRPFAVTSWTIRGANEGILKSILFTSLAPTKSSTFAAPSILPRPDYRCGFIHCGASFGMGILLIRRYPGDWTESDKFRNRFASGNPRQAAHHGLYSRRILSNHIDTGRIFFHSSYDERGQ